MNDISNISVFAFNMDGSYIRQTYLPGKLSVKVVAGGKLYELPWAGFIPVGWARGMTGARSAKICVKYYQAGKDEVTLRPDHEYLLGCVHDHRVWCVIDESGEPRIVK